jgi:hypothetical protein
MKSKRGWRRNCCGSKKTPQQPCAFRLNIFSDGALDLLEHASLEEKIRHLITLNSDQSIQQFLDNAKAIEELPDDISILSIEKESANE